MRDLLDEYRYIVWVDNGCEGWNPTGYNYLEEAINHQSYGSKKIITKKVILKIEESEKELLLALKTANKYLEISTDLKCVNSIFITPAQSLRQQADFIEQKDKDIDFIRQIIKKYEENQ